MRTSREARRRSCVASLSRALLTTALGRFPAHERDLIRRIEARQGDLAREETLPGVARRHAPIDYAFIDADHTEEATVAGFDALRPHLRDRALVVFDDILEGEEMERAWSAVQGRPGIIRALNLRRLGVTVVSAQAR